MTSKKNRLLNSPNTLTPEQRKSIRYKMKLDLKRYADFFVDVMQSDDAQLKDYARSQFGRFVSTAGPTGEIAPEPAEEEESSAESSLW